MNRTVATILSVFFPGAGQLSNGQPLKGIAAMAVAFISLLVLNIWFGMFPYLFWLVWALCIIDAFVVGKKRDARGEPVRKSGMIAGSIIYVVIYGLFGASFVIKSFFSLSDSDKADLEAQAEHRLRDAYHQDFTVTVRDSNLFEAGLVYMDASPKSDPAVTFNVEMSPDGSYYEEHYMAQLLTVQGLPVLQKRVDEAFPDDHLVYVMNDADGSFEQDMKGKLPVGYGDMVAKYPDKIRQDVRIYLFGTFSPEKEKQTMENTMRFLSGFSDGEKQNLAFEVHWYDPSMKENLKAKTGAAMYDYLITHSGVQEAYWLNVWNGEAPKIKSADDLLNYKNKL